MSSLISSLKNNETARFSCIVLSEPQTLQKAQNNNKFCSFSVFDGFCASSVWAWGFDNDVMVNALLGTFELPEYNMHCLWASKESFFPKGYCFSAEFKMKNGYLSIDISSISRVSEEERLVLKKAIVEDRLVDPSSFSEEVKNYAASLFSRYDAFYHLLILLSSPSTFLSFSAFPAGKVAHHTFKGGLLTHIKELYDMFLALSNEGRSSYLFLNVRPELVLIGILGHDAMKVKDYVENSGSFSTTKHCALIGHIHKGAVYVATLIAKANKMAEEHALNTSFPAIFISAEDSDLCVHMILAHHKNLEWGSPVVPAIKEAAVLHHLDMLSADMNRFDYAIEGEYNKFLKTTIFKSDVATY